MIHKYTARKQRDNQLRETIVLDGISFHRYPNNKNKSSRMYYVGSVNKKRTLLHRYIWYKYNGPIPKEMEVDHIDENHNNNTIENYQLLTKSEHAIKSCKHRYTITKIECKICHKEIETSRTTYCSEKCYKNRRAKNHPSYNRNCIECNKEYKGLRKYCSDICSRKYNKKQYNNRKCTTLTNSHGQN